MTERNQQTIRDLYDAATAGDMAAVESFLSDDCVLLEADGHPRPGTWRGREDTMKGILEVFGSIGLAEIKVREVVSGGPHRVVAIIDAYGKDAEGNDYEMPSAECFLVVDGKVTEIRPFYWDTATLRKLVGAA